MALEMKPSCERCSADLPIDGEAFICSYECSFCRNCTLEMHHRCPNCSGELTLRPRRPVPLSAA